MSSNFDCNMPKFPSVTIAIPTYNEENHIEKVIRRFLNTSYPNLLEIIIADGGSTDRTTEIVRDLSSLDSRINLIHNHRKIQSYALNLILNSSQGDIFLRADAHCDYDINYIEKCVFSLLKSDALNVGGAQRFVANNSFQLGVALASVSILGSGGAKYRNPNYEGYAETVYLGCFWRQPLLEIATNIYDENLKKEIICLYDPSQITNEDAEVNQKLLAKSPQAIYISPEIRIFYYPRTNVKLLLQQYFKYGRGRYLTNQKHSQTVNIRGRLPFIVISCGILLVILDLLIPTISLPIVQLFAIVLFLPMLESIRIVTKSRENLLEEVWRGEKNRLPSLLSRYFYCYLAIMIMPFGHFAGYGYQLIRNKIFRIKGW